MPITAFALSIIASIVFGFIVASFYHKSDRANVYQKGRNESEEEREALKEKVQSKDLKLGELGKAAEALKAELEAFKSGSPVVSDGRIEELKTAFEQKTAELLRAEQEASEAYRAQAGQKIVDLEARLAAAEAEREHAREQANRTPAEEPVKGIDASEVEAKIADAVAAAQAELESTKQELNSARQELQARQELAGSEEASRSSSNEAVAAVNGELIRLQQSLDESQAQLAGVQTLRDEIAEWRRLCEEAETKNLAAAETVRQRLEEAKEGAVYEQREALAAAQQEAETKLAAALAARDEAFQQELALREAEATVKPASSEDLADLRELVVRLEGRVADAGRERGGELQTLTGEVANLKQVAVLSRAVCDGAIRYAAQADALRATFETALRAFHLGATSFGADVLGPVRQLQTALESKSAPSVENNHGIEALQQAIDAPPMEASTEALTEA